MSELIASVALDAAAAGSPVEPVPARTARRFIGLLEGLMTQPERGVDAGEAEDFIGEAPKALAVGAAVEDRWAHLTVFNRQHVLLGLA